MNIISLGSQASGKGPSDWFTGAVRIDPLFAANEARRGAAATVTFEPGARTAWHTHRVGQTLIVVSGMGRVQREGGPTTAIRPESVTFPHRPHVPFWRKADAEQDGRLVAFSTQLRVFEWKRDAMWAGQTPCLPDLTPPAPPCVSPPPAVRNPPGFGRAGCGGGGGWRSWG